MIPRCASRESATGMGASQCLDGMTLDIPDRAVTVLFGPAGGGKTTLMRLINRLNDMVDGTQMTGRILSGR